jgi:hypothetical protein
MNEAAALPSPAVVLSARLDRYYGRLRRPPGTHVHFPDFSGYRTGRSGSIRSTAGPGRASPVPAATFQTFHAPIRREVPQGCNPGSTPLPWPSPRPTGLGTSSPLTTRQASLDAADRLVAPPTGLLTLGFDPTRFQTEPPACYRASWQLPGRDSHPLATTSLCRITIYISTSDSGRTRGK